MSLAEQCPLCGTKLSQTKYVEIQSILSQQEKQKETENKKLVAEAQSSIRRELEQQFQAELKKQKESAALAAKQASEEQINKLVSERDRANEMAQAANGRVAEIREVAAREKEAAMKLVKKEAQEAIAKITRDREDLNKKLKQAEARATLVRKEAQEEAARKIQKELVEQRAVLEKDRDEKLLKLEAGFNRERESLQKKAKLMEQQLQKKTANEIGDGAEIGYGRGNLGLISCARCYTKDRFVDGSSSIQRIGRHGRMCSLQNSARIKSTLARSMRF